MQAIRMTVIVVVILAGITLSIVLSRPKEPKTHPISSYSNSTEVAVVVIR